MVCPDADMKTAFPINCMKLCGIDCLALNGGCVLATSHHSNLEVSLPVIPYLKGITDMTLSFPNPSRTYDEVRNAVRFIGHDGMFEIRFFVEAAALAAAAPQGTRMAETECLSAFDAMRKSIYDVADRVYSRKRRNISTLTADDFR